MATTIDVRGALAAELKRLVRDEGEWPMADRRRFRNLLLDAASSDVLPLAELLLRVVDDGMLASLPARGAARVEWDAAAGRLASDLQLRRFVEPGVARFVADAWINALGPDPVPSTRVAAPRPVIAPRPPVRSAPPAVPARAVVQNAASNAASIRAYQRANVLTVAMAAVFVILMVLAFRSTNRRPSVAPQSVTQQPEPAPVAASAAPAAPSAPTQQAATPAAPSAPMQQAADLAAPSAPMQQAADPAAPSPPMQQAPDPRTRASDSAAAATRAPVVVSAGPARSTDDIVLNAGRVFEGRVLSVRQQSVVVKDAETGLDFEIDKSDIDRIVTSDGRIMRFGDDNVPVIGDNNDLTARSNAGTYRVRYAERWGAERAECREMARRFAPGSTLVVRHLRGAPMMQLQFVDGPGFNAAVRSDGLFESGAAQAPDRGPSNAFVSRRLSGRLTRTGDVQGVARLTAVTADGSVVCDVALTVRGERVP